MAKQPSDDLFEGTKMTFGQHLEELRRALIFSVLGLVAGTLAGLLLAKHVVTFIQVPLISALEEYYIISESEKLKEDFDGNPPPEMLRLLEDRRMLRETIYMEPLAIVKMLKAADHDKFGGIKIAPHRILETDIKDGDFGRLCARLKRDGARSKASPGKAMWNLATDDQRELIRRLAGEKDVSEEDKFAVLDVLNALAENKRLTAGLERISGYEKEDWKNWVPWWGESYRDSEKAFQETVKELRAKKKLNGDQRRRLNKILIAHAFSDVMNRPRTQIVEVPIWKETEVRVQALGSQEAFMIWIKAAFVTGFLIASPWIFWQVWNFVAAGLYPHEKNYVYIYLPFSLLLFIGGAAMAFFFVFEPVLTFLFSFNRMMGIDPDPRISEWLSFVLFLPLGFGIAFQLPLVMLFVNRIGIVTTKTYVEKWRIAILVIFTISMLLTPADPISMLLMALPLTFLYFLGICLCKWMPRRKSVFAELTEAM